MTHVLMTADCVGGVWTYALELVDALAAEGVSVTLATMGRRPDRAQRRQAARTALRGLHASDWPLEWEPEAWAGVDDARGWLLRLEDELSPDVVHLNGYAHGASPWRAPVVVVAHSCVWSWWWAVRGTTPPPEWNEYRRRATTGLRAAGAVVAPSHAMLDQVRRWYGVDGEVIPNSRRDWLGAAPRKEPLILCAGRIWDEAKNIRAVTRVAARLPWAVAVAGDPGPGGAPGADGGAVLALGRISFEELTGWLERAAIYAAPARYEPFGLGPLEAGLAGCALLLGDIPSLREVWGDAGVYADPGDDEAILAALRALVDDRPRRERLGQQARRRALQHAPRHTAAAYRSLYDRLRAGAAEPATARGGGR